MFLLDYNEDRSIQISSNLTENDQHSKSTFDFGTAAESVQSAMAKVHIDTLSPSVSFGEGIYSMSVIKRMSATDDFLEMPLEERNCEVELYEDCRTRKLFKHCNCVPWEMSGFQVQFLENEVYHCFPFLYHLGYAKM